MTVPAAAEPAGGGVVAGAGAPARAVVVHAVATTNTRPATTSSAVRHGALFEDMSRFSLRVACRSDHRTSAPRRPSGVDTHGISVAGVARERSTVDLLRAAG